MAPMWTSSKATISLFLMKPLKPLISSVDRGHGGCGEPKQGAEDSVVEHTLAGALGAVQHPRGAGALTRFWTMNASQLMKWSVTSGSEPRAWWITFRMIGGQAVIFLSGAAMYWLGWYMLMVRASASTRIMDCGSKMMRHSGMKSPMGMAFWAQKSRTCFSLFFLFSVQRVGGFDVAARPSRCRSCLGRRQHDARGASLFSHVALASCMPMLRSAAYVLGAALAFFLASR